MRIITIIFITICLIGCDKDTSSTSPELSCNAAYAGVWKVTDSGTYENSDCTGAQISNYNVNSYEEHSWTLSEDCTHYTLDSFTCSDSTEEGYADLCTGSWSSAGNIISVPIFFGLMTNQYIVDENGTVMSTSLTVSTGPNEDEMVEQCQYTVYTKQDE